MSLWEALEPAGPVQSAPRPNCIPCTAPEPPTAGDAALRRSIAAASPCCPPLPPSHAADDATGLSDASPALWAGPGADDGAAAAPHLGRRLLVDHRAGGGAADASLAIDPTPEASIAALAFRFSSEALLDGLADAQGLTLVPDYEARALALDALAAQAKALAAAAIATARAQLAQLDAALRAGLPHSSDAAGEWAGGARGMGHVPGRQMCAGGARIPPGGRSHPSPPRHRWPLPPP